jgi:hypothetical protein
MHLQVQNGTKPTAPVKCCTCSDADRSGTLARIALSGAVSTD